MVEIPKAIWEGTFIVLGVKVKCHVLDDGQRIVEAESMEKLFAAMTNPKHHQMGDFSNFLAWSKGLKNWKEAT